MKLVWVDGTLPLSKAIMWSLDEPVSHFALIFDDKIVFHSDLSGVRISWLNSFLKTHSIVYQVDYSNTSLDLQEEVYQNIIDANDGKFYDYLGFLYFAWRALLRKLFKIPFPEENILAFKDMFLCVEIAKALPEHLLPEKVKKADLAITTPYRLWLMFQDESLSK